ncbi:MAG TPA: tryptophan--tRNA ligase [bacterium]|nr:tryptophan--tRNA ligase [bacterium]
MQRMISGIKSTGYQIHLGNYFGLIRPFTDHHVGRDSAIFIADLHSITTVKDGRTLRRNSHEIAAELMAIFPDESVTIFRQGDIRDLPILNWVLNNVTPYSLMLRAHSFKDSQAKNSDINMGVFNYPILMAADILGYDSEIVPVGRDQTQHLEFARDIAESFNKTYESECFTLPDAVFGDVPVLPGFDGRKMSKSYDNYMSFFEDETSIKKKIMSIKTDSKGVEEQKDPEECTVFSYIRLFGESAEVEEIAAKYRSGGYGYGHAKLALFDIIMRYSAGYRARREELLSNPDRIRDRLATGSEKMNARMTERVACVRELAGI